MLFDAHAATLRPRRAVEAATRLRFAPSIVWQCLVDPVLAEGWLGQVLLSADAVGGRFAVVWPTGEPHEADWFGTISEIEPQRRLQVRFDPHTSVAFDLTNGGAGAGSCSVRVRHESFLSAAEQREVAAFWNGRLEYLSELLHGRPVDWNRESNG
jgi:uncharacterized protein YndB with AHSA1/START domain